jgi:SAM-dependent methyltransferase
MNSPETDFGREQLWWDAKAAKEEIDSADEAINRALRWREIERHLAGVKTILDVGGATGSFSIPLARRGFRVTHLDLSPEMLAMARQQAQDVTGLTFLEGKASDLTRFAGRSFDLVLNMDGAISFSGRDARRAIQETCRVAGKTVILTVSHQAQLAAAWVGLSLTRTGRINHAAQAMIDRGEWHQEQFPDNGVMTVGLTQNYMGALKAFLPGEMTELLRSIGMQVLRCGGLGSLASLCDRDVVTAIAKDSALMEPFLDACELFDREIQPSGPGTRLRAGLIAVACRPE